MMTRYLATGLVGKYAIGISIMMNLFFDCKLYQLKIVAIIGAKSDIR